MHGAEGRVGVYGGVQGRWSAVGVGEGGVGMCGGQSGGGGGGGGGGKVHEAGGWSHDRFYGGISQLVWC